MSEIEIQTYLEVDDNKGDDNSGHEVAKVGSVLAVESLLETVELVGLSEKEVEKSDDCTFEFSALVGSNSNWRERFPEDLLADVGGDKERNT